MINGPTKFRSTVCQPYHRLNQTPTCSPNDHLAAADQQDKLEVPTSIIPRSRGRPKGSKSKPKSPDHTTITESSEVYLSKKEENDRILAIKLRNDGVITTPGKPFEASDAKEINDLVIAGVFNFELFDPALHQGRIFKSRMVRTIKGQGGKPYEKSRLVIEGRSDFEKLSILTQSPTIQRMSQRLILAIAPSLCHTGMTISLRDITQAYPQAHSQLQRQIFAELPQELKDKYPEGTIIRVIKPPYGIAEAGVHWFHTYQEHHKQQLGMEMSTSVPFLLITVGSADSFGIVGMQTDDTLMLGTESFSVQEEMQLEKAKFRAKARIVLKPGIVLDFNGVKLSISHDDILVLRQKRQGAKIEVNETKRPDSAQRYLEQRARGAYIVSICQPEASFDLSAAAQVQKPQIEDYQRTNKRLHGK
ncbi:hypothetical protein K3495_g7531 [Podosphaera aphanis]|nr:hypothetical protein K3495_g7531 [Podosphaera aphanis]